MKKEFLLEKKWHIVLGGVAGLTLLMGAFSLGVRVGFHKANFSGRVGENFYRNYGGDERGRGMMRNFNNQGAMLDRNLPGAHGTAGEVLDLNSRGLTVMDRDGVEKSIIVTNRTLIKKFRDDIRLTDLRTGDFVTVMGRPDNQGQIEASLVRVMPNPEQAPFEVIKDGSKETSSVPASSTSVK